jgi:type IV pilus assembly protein PilB
LISSAIVGVIAQRLVRRLCKKCKKEHVPDKNERKILGISENDNVVIFVPVGCDECNNIGYKGRIAVHEILTFNRELRDLVTQNVTADVLKDAAVKLGMRTLRHNCIRLILNGVTTIEEMFNISNGDD